VHAPLVFDLIDCWMERSIGQCTYHVEPPDGRYYTTRPLNAAEAEGRRLKRFQVGSPSLGLPEIPGHEINPIFPGTLDLRIPPPSSRKRIETREFLP
jgi:uncharacterized protein (DUF2126 family)